MTIAKGSFKKSAFRRRSFPAAFFLILLIGAAGYLRILYLENKISLDFLKKNPRLSKPQPEFPSSKKKGFIYVHIDGEVNNPGLYCLSEGSRLGHLIEEAGGLTTFASKGDLNLALSLIDGTKIHIPKQGIFKRAGIGQAPPPTYIIPPIIVERIEG
ncbi:MAG: hypothetical protein GX817_04220, partial [Elusimicrobia bacterium]|nr:hypothetical protein [Elusimicrobiota bacterium]